MAGAVHGDPRFTNLQVDDFRDAVKLLAHLDEARAADIQPVLQAMVSGALDAARALYAR